MERTFKIFLIAGITAGIFTGILFLYLYRSVTGLLSGFAAGSIFGLITVYVVSFLHNKAVKKIASEKSDKNPGIDHIRDILMPFPFDKTFNICLLSLDAINKCKVHKEDRSIGKILARTGLNWKTWGDTIVFEIRKANDAYTEVRISSRPTARTTLVDFGKNLDNVEKLIAFLKKQIDQK